MVQGFSSLTSAGNSSGADITHVEYYSNLPDATTNNGKYYFVDKDTIWNKLNPLAKTQGGLYRSDGTTWLSGVVPELAGISDGTNILVDYPLVFSGVTVNPTAKTVTINGDTQSEILAKLGDALTFKNFTASTSSGISVYTVSTTTVPANTNTKISLNVETYDYLSEFDTTNNTFTPSYSQLAMVYVRLAYTNSAGELQFFIRRNDNQAIEGRTFYSSGKYQNGTYVIPTVLTAGVAYEFCVRSDVSNTLNAVPIVTIVPLSKS